jgi:predicted nucleotidyltransferase
LRLAVGSRFHLSPNVEVPHVVITATARDRDGIDASRPAEFESVVGAVAAWVRGRPDIRGLALVGSWARGRAHAGSDVDLVVLADDPARYADDDSWIVEALGRPAVTVRRRAWGVVTERRALLPSGLEVELGLAPLSWACCEPLDPGTAEVVRGGCRPVVDAEGRVARLIAAVARSNVSSSRRRFGET